MNKLLSLTMALMVFSCSSVPSDRNNHPTQVAKPSSLALTLKIAGHMVDFNAENWQTEADKVVAEFTRRIKDTAQTRAQKDLVEEGVQSLTAHRRALFFDYSLRIVFDLERLIHAVYSTDAATDYSATLAQQERSRVLKNVFAGVIDKMAENLFHAEYQEWGEYQYFQHLLKEQNAAAAENTLYSLFANEQKELLRKKALTQKETQDITRSRFFFSGFIERYHNESPRLTPSPSVSSVRSLPPSTSAGSLPASASAGSLVSQADSTRESTRAASR